MRFLSLALVTLFLSSFAHAVDRVEPADRREPQPFPQGDFFADSDYSEAKKLLSKKKWEEAAIVLRSVFKKSPEFSPGAIELARALAYAGRREEALSVLNQAASHQIGARRTALISRAKVLSRLFLTVKTLQIYQEGMNFLHARKYRLARERFEKALEHESDNVEVLTRIGQCLVMEGDYDSAAERLRFAKRLNSAEPEIRLWLGRAMHQRGELNEALDELKSAYEGLDASERAPVWYSEALVSAGQRKAAAQMLEQDGKIQPFHVLALMALSKVRAQLAREGGDTFLNARKDLQLALSRLSKYDSGELARFEGELGIDFKEPSVDLKAEITKQIAQLDSRALDLPMSGRQKR